MNRKLQVLGSFLLVAMLLGVVRCQSSTTGSSETASVDASSSPTCTAYLPYVAHPGAFSRNRSIWPATSTPTASHAVALFRRDFNLHEALSNAEILVFADTRYELWLDGTWIGRGPARFSQATKEYDVYQVDDLQPGNHLIAVLVQWAPNTRRSESQTPSLLSHVQGTSGKGREVLAGTGPGWKALLSDAWRRDSAPVHEWRLIGPTELVDLRKLPPDWMLPSFSDDDWPAAEVKAGRAGAVYRPRSIPILDQVPMTATVISTGRLSLGYAIGELTAAVSTPYSLSFQSLETGEWVLETLTGTEASLSTFASLDGNDLDWKRAGTHRPDVYVASTTIGAGDHSLLFADIPPRGLTFGMSTQGISPVDVPFGQSAHAGRRLLLAEPASYPTAVSISSGEGLTLTLEETPAYAVLDLGRVIHGRLETKISGPSGTVVDIGWDERLLTGTLRPLPYPGSMHPQWNQTDSWVLDGASRSIRTIDARAGRYVLIAAWNGSPVELQDIRFYEERYAAVQRGRFHSSNALLNEIWQTGVDSLYPNMTDAYTDTPWRERGQWWGDAYVEEHINRVSCGDTVLLRRGLRLMAGEFVQGRPPARAPHGGGELLLDYGMLWVESLHDHYQITEDRHLLTEVYPVLREFVAYLDHYEDTTTDLLGLPGGHLTALIDWRGSHSRYGQSAAINALYYGTLMDASHLAEAVNRADDARTWRQKAQRIKDRVNTHLYLPSRGRYATTLFRGETVTPSIHAQAWPLAYGLVPEEHIADVASALLELLPRELESGSPEIGIYGMFWALEGLGQANRISEAVDLIEDYYGHLLDLGATTWWEEFDSHLSYTASLSHGWGGAPTWFLTTYVLGARRQGVDTWLVKPTLSSVRHASGSLPLGSGGRLDVQWERLSCEEVQLRLVAPVTTTGEVVISFVDETMTLTLNDQPIWQDGEPLAHGVVELGDEVHISLRGGSHSLSVLRDCPAVVLPVAQVKDCARSTLYGR